MTVGRQKDRARTGFILLSTLPTTLLYLVLFILPFIYAFYLSLFRWKGYSLDNMVFCGLRNFRQLLQDPIILRGLKNNLFFMFWSTIVIFLLAMLFAICLTRLKQIRHPSFFRIIYFFPNVLSVIVVGVLWSFIYNPNFGLLNGILRTLGLENWICDWLGDEDTVMGALIAPQSWTHIGFYMVLFIAAIQNIPEEYYDSALIDGANELQQAVSITFPLIWGTIRMAIVFFVINAFVKTFALVYVVTGGGPNHASELLTTYMYNKAFKYSDFGYGAAIGVFLFVIVAIISFAALKLTKRDTVEY